MMPVIRISDATYQKLKQFAVPLDDTPDSVIGRLVDAALSSMPSLATQNIQGSVGTIPQDQILTSKDEDLGNLAHTWITSAQFDGTPIIKANWNKLAKFAHEAAYKNLGSLDALRRLTNARLREGRYEDEGFSYLKDIDLSIQGMDSQQAWENTICLAKAIGVIVEVTFEWRNHPKAAKPGQASTLRFAP